MLHRLWQNFISSLEIKCISLQQWYLGVWYLEYLLSLIHLTTTHHDLVPLTDISRSTDFVKIYVESRNKVHFSAALIAGSMKPCIVIVLDTLNHHRPWCPWPTFHAPLSLSKFYVKSRIKVHSSAAAMAEDETLHRLVFKHTPWPIFCLTYIACCSYFTKCRCDIDLCGVLVLHTNGCWHLDHDFTLKHSFM